MKSTVHTGMYLGVVIQNNDPDFRGRVKVYVPHIQANVYENWFKELSDKSFRFPGQNIQSDLSKILPELKTVLPWADNAMPMIGATGSGRYNAHDDLATISDSNRHDTLKPDTHETDIEKKYKLNEEHVGEKPGKVYESHNTWLNDAFTNLETVGKDDWSDTTEETATLNYSEEPEGQRLNGVNRPNIHAHNYRPSTYSNCAKGSFSIPNVGSHVWVFFKDGDPLLPVMFGVSYGQEDWRGIFDSHESHGQDYPGTYENVSKFEEPVYDVNTETYRNKYVINQKGGALEFVNTDNREILKMTHYSGSFMEFNNHANIELATKNAQRLVLEDSYDTVRGYKNEFTERDLDCIIRGDRYKRIGYQHYNLHQRWHELATGLANVKSLFDIQRVDGVPGFNGVEEQKKVGEHAPCPVCNDEGVISYHAVNSMLVAANKTDTSTSVNGAEDATSVGNNYVGYNNPIGRSYSEPIAITYKNVSGSKQFVAPPYQSGSKHVGGGSGKIFGEKCPVCGGKGKSPSTMNGTWEPEPKKQADWFNEFLKFTTEELAKVESKLGMGGSEFINIAKHKTETIGLIMNQFPSVRIDPIGKMYRDKMVIHKKGVFAHQSPSPLIESVHVDDSPGGVYALNVSSRWNVHVGSGGIAIKTYGRMEIAGTQVNVTGEQVNVASQNEVNIDGGKRLSIVGDIISIRQRKRGQVLVDSDLSVSQNVVIGGGLHVEGELSCNHLTIPAEVWETECAKIYSKMLTGLQWKCNINGGSHVVSPHGTGHPSWSGATVTLISDSNDDHIVDYSHSHLYKSGAMHLMSANEDVREVAKKCNANTDAPSRAPASDREILAAEEKVKGSGWQKKTEKADPGTD